MQELQVVRGDGSYPRLLARWAKTDALMDDFGLTALGAQERHDLLEVIERLGSPRYRDAEFG